MGRRVPGWAGFAAAPVVVFLTICSYYAYTRHYRTVSGNAAGSPVDSAVLQQSTDPQALLGIADHFYWLNNGPAAAPLYARAKQLFLARGDARNELHAKVGRLRSEAETMSFVDLSRFLNEQLQNPIVPNDKSLWSADDTFASALMEQFYRHLAQGEDTSSALRNAKLDLLAKYGDQVSPFYWAAFIAVGETSTPIGIRQQ